MKKLITLVLLVLLSVVGCTGAPITISTQGGQPSIISFNAEQASISAGQSANLSWNVTGATTITIDQGIGNVALTGTRAVTPAATTTYTLTALSAAGTATATTQVIVTGASATPPSTPAEPPAVDYFIASPSVISTGDSAILGWSVSNATSITINNGVGSVGSAGTTVVSPTTSTNYTLTATNAAGLTSETLTIVVGAAPASGMPDLIVEDIVRSGDSITYTITNQGDAAAGPSTSTLLVDGLTVANDSVSSMAPGESKTETFAGYTYSCTLPSDSSEVKADTGNTVVESSEANNSRSESWTCIFRMGPILPLALKPDLVVEDIWIDGHTIRYRIKNQGLGASAAGYSRLYIEGVVKGNDGVPVIAAGDIQSGSFMYDFDCALPILKEVKVSADYGGTSTETNETNNSRTEDIVCP